MHAISCKKLVKEFSSPPVAILKSVSFDISEGQFVALTGKSGSGKSTLLYAISGLDSLTSGQVLLEGQDIPAMSPRGVSKFRNSRIGFVFQHHYLIPELTALDNVLLPARKAGMEQNRREYAMHLMESFGVIHRRGHTPGEMSGGEMQRTSVARALVMSPSILFADEPTGNLDTENGNRVMEIFYRVNRESKTTILMVTHDPDQARNADREIQMVDGVISSDLTRVKTDTNRGRRS